MADHVRKQIREALEIALNGMATASTLYISRVQPIDADDLPAAVLFTNAEESERHTKGNVLVRRLTVSVEGHAQTASGLDDTLDQIAKEIEIAIDGAGNLGGLISSSDLIGTEIEFSEAVQPVGLIRLTYIFTYATTEAAPDVAL